MDELQLLLIHLGKKVKYLRRLHNLTQAQLAEKADLSVNYVSEIETGTACPTLKTLFILAQQLHVQLHDLFDFDTTTEIGNIKK